MIVNDVAGFIGPEVFRTTEQLMRACLEDLFMGKMHGLAMGLDVCSTYHMGIAPAQLDELNESLVHAAPAYLMAVAGKSDPMLGYLTTDFRSHPRLRNLSGRSVTTPFRRRLIELGVMRNDGSLTDAAGEPAPLAREFGEDESDIRRTTKRLQERGMDVGHGYEKDFRPPAPMQAHLALIFKHARKALYRTIAPETMKASSKAFVRVRSMSRDRDEYIGRPRSAKHAPNGRREPGTGGCGIPYRGDPGGPAGRSPHRRTAWDRDEQSFGLHHVWTDAGRRVAMAPPSRWRRIEHSSTTALCSINRNVGVKPAQAAVRIANLVKLMARHRGSGIALVPHLHAKDKRLV